MSASSGNEADGLPPLDTAARATALGDAARSFPALGLDRPEALLDLVAAELGHRAILDGFQPCGSDHHAAPLRTRAIAPRRILHIVAGNTPLAGLQSLIRGLLLGAENFVKLPSAGLPEIDRFVAALPGALRDQVSLDRELDPLWLREASAIVVFGDDATVHHFRKQVRTNQIFVAHGHRISFAVVFSDADAQAATLAALDIGLHNQQGCLSPHDIYVDETAGSDARNFAADLATAMAAYEEKDPRGPISAAEAADITALRDSYRFRAANDDRVAIWSSDAGTDWTVIYESDPQFAVSPLNRVVFVKPLPPGGAEALTDELRLVRPYLSTIALHPFTEAHAARLTALGASRLCAIGRAQQPHPLWHQDGLAQLSPLVRWQDLG